MLRQRTIVGLVLLPIGMTGIILGGWYYTALIAAILGIAAWEYTQLMRAGGLQPASLLVIGGVLLLVVGRALDGFDSAPWVISLLVLLSTAWHLLAYEHGRNQSATDLGVTLGGILYLGWIGGYFISLRNLPNGLPWVLLVLPAVWSADMGAYVVGHLWGRHKLSPRLSPKKTWEGYLGGIVGGVVMTTLIAALWEAGAGLEVGITPLRGAIMGLVMGIFPTLGDLGESMIKRQVGAKDSSNLLPGHGGFFDRIDSWLWAVVLGYYLITWLWL
jgi:phosphatidate cytidylyltransferase